MESVKRFQDYDVGMCEWPGGEWVRAADFDRVTAENQALQQRLTTADQRIDELEAAPVPPQGDAQPVVDLIIRDICEHEPDDTPNSIHISIKALELILLQHMTSPDVGEVERLRAEVADLLEENRLMTRANAACGNEVVRMRAQLAEKQTLADNYCALLMDANSKLAERDALLRDIHDGMISGHERWLKIESVLSASAEPATVSQKSEGV